MLFVNLYLGFPRGVFTLTFCMRVVCMFLVPAMLAACPDSHILFDFIKKICIVRWLYADTEGFIK